MPRTKLYVSAVRVAVVAVVRGRLGRLGVFAQAPEGLLGEGLASAPAEREGGRGSALLRPSANATGRARREVRRDSTKLGSNKQVSVDLIAIPKVCHKCYNYTHPSAYIA